jgi:hypothetical protein
VKINQVSRKKRFMTMAPYPNTTRLPSSQGSGITCPAFPFCSLCISIYQKTTESKKQQLQINVNFEKKRMKRV